MPNHCENHLIVRGEDKDLLAFVEAVRGKGSDATRTEAISFDRVIPYPSEFAEKDKAREEWDKAWDKMTGEQRQEFRRKTPQPEDGYNHGGYEWCKANWGTKWDAYNTLMFTYMGGREFRFQTAWEPPIPVVHKLAELFPLLQFELHSYEQGMAERHTVSIFKYDDDAKPQVHHDRGNYEGIMGG